jgi:hypothetical protein
MNDEEIESLAEYHTRVDCYNERAEALIDADRLDDSHEKVFEMLYEECMTITMEELKIKTITDWAYKTR